ncbi:hypothetical protein E2C01_060899 [Portunus trituberculatus]|uniref:Uncharacterized protein n=1 Tax=Portunus trituberculatus TaxID=210409 RepID=A0A5B7HCX4_PORTR|nr:hypothetical protein [Portunus trituberculatus]
MGNLEPHPRAAVQEVRVGVRGLREEGKGDARPDPARGGRGTRVDLTMKGSHVRYPRHVSESGEPSLRQPRQALDDNHVLLPGKE